MDTEFEAKFYPVNKDKYRQKLRSIGAKLIVPERKMRRAIIDALFHPEFTCDYIRIRDEGNLIRLSAKTHANQTGKLSDQKEIDVEVSDYDKTIQILEQMGYKPERYQETLRETWEFEGAEITIDTWPGLDSYSEIEVKLEGQIKSIAEKLGFNWDKKIITAAIEIFAEVYQIGIDKALDMTSNISFENNPFAKLVKHAIMNQQSV
ncbi:MAG: CYTH domain-containing protein [Patescibacteria group bacterium]